MMEEVKATQRTALVTGAAQGIGKTIAIAFAHKGVNLILADRQTKKLKQTVKELRQLHSKVIGIRCDVRKKTDVERVFNMGMEKMKRVDFLVNNAGIALNKPLVDMEYKEWENMVSTNLNGIFYCSKQAVPIMVNQKFGVIINISSGLGKHGMKNFSAYSASKFGVIGLTESLAEEVKDFNIKVYAVCPGGVNTEMYKSIFPNAVPDKLLKPENIAQHVLKLCFENYLVKTGTSIEVNEWGKN